MHFKHFVNEKRFDRESTKEERDQYQKAAQEMFRTSRSGARFWGQLAVAPEGGANITNDMAVDYGIPNGQYDKIGVGSSSIVFSNGTQTVKFSVNGGRPSISGDSKGWTIQDPEDVIVERKRHADSLNKISQVEPIELPDTDKFFMDYSTYKSKKERGESVDLPRGVSYNKFVKGFAYVDTYSFDSLNCHTDDSGIIYQDLLPSNAKDIPVMTIRRVVAYLKEKGIYTDPFRPNSNMKMGDGAIYIMDA